VGATLEFEFTLLKAPAPSLFQFFSELDESSLQPSGAAGKAPNGLLRFRVKPKVSRKIAAIWCKVARV
jgi:hypothetical protein